MSRKHQKLSPRMYSEIKKRTDALITKKKDAFSAKKSELFLDLPDAHSVSVVTSHLGLPLHKIKLGKYDIHDKDTQVQKSSLERYKEAFEELVKHL